MGSAVVGQNAMLVVIDYNMGNVRSVAKAFELLGCDVAVTSDVAAIRRASHLVLPGVGAFADGMRNLQTNGLIEVLHDEAVNRKKPFLGICLGMQLLARESEEFGRHKGLGWFDARVVLLNARKRAVKVPHVGWNNIYVSPTSVLLKGVPPASNCYFVHSYHFVTEDDSLVAATCEYGGPVVAAIERGNIVANQFHPEKSQRTGLMILKNFLAMKSRV